MSKCKLKIREDSCSEAMKSESGIGVCLLQAGHGGNHHCHINNKCYHWSRKFICVGAHYFEQGSKSEIAYCVFCKNRFEKETEMVLPEIETLAQKMVWTPFNYLAGWFLTSLLLFGFSSFLVFEFSDIFYSIIFGWMINHWILLPLEGVIMGWKLSNRLLKKTSWRLK